MILPDADQSSSVEATPIEPIGNATPGWTTEPWREPFEPAVEPPAAVANTRSTNTKPKARPDQLVPAGWVKEEWKDEWAEVSGASVVQSTQTAGKTHGRAASKARRAAAAVRAKRSLDSHHVLGTPRAAPHIHPIEDKRRVTGEIVPSAEPTLSGRFRLHTLTRGSTHKCHQMLSVRHITSLSQLWPMVWIAFCSSKLPVSLS
jgi:hypothetical protein